MLSVLIAQRDAEFANSLAALLEVAGYRPIICAGPWPPALRCIRCDIGYCPLTKAADVMIYDPDLVGYDAAGQAHLLAVQSAQAHPDVPMLLAWPADEAPESLTMVMACAGTTQIAATEPHELVEQIQRLVVASVGLVVASPV